MHSSEVETVPSSFLCSAAIFALDACSERVNHLVDVCWSRRNANSFSILPRPVDAAFRQKNLAIARRKQLESEMLYSF